MKSLWLLSIMMVVVLLGASGCGMKPRLYAVDRPRVDQANMGNAGYVAGDKKDGKSIEDRNTRRIYVFEFDKKKKAEANQDLKKTDAPASEPQTPAPSPEITPTKEGITLPYIGDDEPQPQATAQSEVPETGMMYTVVKDDTLQKISKKVYGTFGKWTKIYDANKEKIKNPNFVKPGTVLVIPAVD